MQLPQICTTVSLCTVQTSKSYLIPRGLGLILGTFLCQKRNGFRFSQKVCTKTFNYSCCIFTFKRLHFFGKLYKLSLWWIFNAYAMYVVTTRISNR